MKSIAAIVFALMAVVGAAQPLNREADVENPTPGQLEQLKGKIVVVDGLLWGWGSGWPGLGARIILPSGTRIYFTGGKFMPDSPNGRPVRIHGRLTLRHWREVGRRGSGYGMNFDYWTIDEPTAIVLEKIENDVVLEYIAPPVRKEGNQPSEPERADQPATKPAAKPPAKDQPVTPASG